HHNLAVFPFRSHEAVWRVTMLDPVHDHQEPIHLRSAGAAAAMKTTWNQEEPAIIARPGVMSLHLAVVINRSLRRQRGVGPAVPNDQLPFPGFEIRQIRVGGVKK